MVRIKVFKASQLLYWAVIVIVAVALLGLIASALLGGGEAKPTKTPATQQTTAPETIPLPDAGGTTSRGGVVDRQAAVYAAQATSAPPTHPEGETSKVAGGGLFSSIMCWIFDVDISDPASMISYHLPLSIGTVDSVAVTAGETTGGEELPDESDVGEHIRVEIARITEPYKAAGRGKILIYHTHTYEAYEQTEGDLYVEASAQWRTKDEDYSIVGVGDKLEQELIALGYEVVHDKTEFEPPKLGTAYERSLQMLQQRMGAGEEYALVIDLHRDAWDTKQQKQMTADVGGQEAARLMMLIGTGEGADGNTFSIKPNWKENYKLAEALTSSLNAKNPGLCRDVLVKTGRYNQHMSDQSVLIEVGNNRNTLMEALSAMPPLAKAIDDVLSTK